MPIETKLDIKDEVIVKDYLSAISDNKNPLRHENYYDSVSHYKEMAVHLEGADPGELISAYRPNEPKEIHEYRLSIYEPITTAKAERVTNKISKIQNSSNFSINYPKEQDSSIPEGEGLKEYVEEGFPVYGSLQKWVFGILLEQMLADPNGLVAIVPKRGNQDPADFFKPVGKNYRSDQVVDYDLDNYYTILLDEKSIIKKGNQNVREGLIFWVFTNNEVVQYTQIKQDGNKKIFEEEVIWEHNFGEAPVFFLGGKFKQNSFPPLRKSFISGILPYWNKAIRMDSDLDAQYVQHAYLERVEVEVECDALGCSYNEDKGYYGVTTNGECERCHRCNGNGYITGRSPYGVTRVRKEEIGERAMEFPGVEYVSKPVDIVKLTEEKISQNIKDGMSAILMDILSNVGADQSGVAKVIDRSDMNDFLMLVSDNIFDNIIKNSYKYINLWRYYNLFSGNKERIKANLPTINKPTDFDVMSVNMLVAEMQSFGEAGISNEALSLMEKDIVDKKFINDSEARQLLTAIADLDPIPNRTEDDKMVILANGGTTRENYIISANIKPFILRALSENESFLKQSREDKMAKLKEYADDLNQFMKKTQIAFEDGSTTQDT